MASYVQRDSRIFRLYAQYSPNQMFWLIDKCDFFRGWWFSVVIVLLSLRLFVIGFSCKLINWIPFIYIFSLGPAIAKSTVVTLVRQEFHSFMHNYTKKLSFMILALSTQEADIQDIITSSVPSCCPDPRKQGGTEWCGSNYREILNGTSNEQNPLSIPPKSSTFSRLRCNLVPTIRSQISWNKGGGQMGGGDRWSDFSW